MSGTHRPVIPAPQYPRNTQGLTNLTSKIRTHINAMEATVDTNTEGVGEIADELREGFGPRSNAAHDAAADLLAGFAKEHLNTMIQRMKEAIAKIERLQEDRPNGHSA